MICLSKNTCVWLTYTLYKHIQHMQHCLYMCIIYSIYYTGDHRLMARVKGDSNVIDTKETSSKHFFVGNTKMAISGGDTRSYRYNHHSRIDGLCRVACWCFWIGCTILVFPSNPPNWCTDGKKKLLLPFQH